MHYITILGKKRQKPYHDPQALANDSYGIHIHKPENTLTAKPTDHLTVTVTNHDRNLNGGSADLRGTPADDALDVQCNPSYGSSHDLIDTVSTNDISNDTISSHDIINDATLYYT